MSESQTQSRPPTVFSDFCVILYLGKATAKLYVEAHRVERQTEKNILVWKALGREITALEAHVCVSDLSIVCKIADLSTHDNMSDLCVLSTTSLKGTIKSRCMICT